MSLSTIRAIRSEGDHAAALARIEALLDADPGSPEAEELEIWATLVDAYEARTFPIRAPSPATAILFHMEQAGLTEHDLVPHIGTLAAVRAVISGERPLNLRMIRALHRRFGIPADVLLREPEKRPA